MKKYYPFIATGLVGIILGFLIGVTLRSEYERKVIAKSMYVISQSMDTLRFGKAHTLIKVFKKYEEDHNAGADFLKRLIAVEYDKRNSGLENLFKDVPDSDAYYENNLVVEEFLREHPLQECLEVPETDRASCSIENRIPKK